MYLFLASRCLVHSFPNSSVQPLQGKTGPAKGPFAIELPREASTIEAQNALRRQLKIKDKKLVLKLRNHRKSLIPINCHILQNTKFQPYTLEVMKRFQNVKPVQRSVPSNGYNDMIKQRLEILLKRIEALEEIVPEMKQNRGKKMQKEMEGIDVNLQFIGQRIRESENHKWQGMFTKHPLW
ncbi:hypothetical protein BSL78_01809 [Apostichopus japonicus]|uniref:Uncharacterized protein n=1 Tax=Stichopus japonicus TaxID=307972 RepID=A0A2G8LM50_STIJA|nr:hypothetical protein BSL78_01809 [Apostichopus japonicus]